MERVTRCSPCDVNGAGEYILYWMTACRRRHFNFALERAVFWATELRKPLVILEGLAFRYPWANARIHTFVMQGMQANLNQFKSSAVSYYPFVERFPGEGSELLSRIGQRACLIFFKQKTAYEIPKWISTAASRFPVLF